MSKLNSHRSLIASLAGLFMAISTATAQTTWYVDDDNCPGPGSGTEGDPFCSVQDGIDGASGGDTIEVSPGTYNEAIDFLGKAITVLSSGGPEVTTMDATGLNTSVVTCVSGEGRGTVLDGFTITGGTGTNDYGDTFGGGMFTFAASPTVVNCKFIGNTCASGGGGGMYSNSGAPMVANCTFSGNTGTGSTAYGGGMWNNGSSPTVTNCTFSGNSAYSGGGIHNSVSAAPTVTNCTFSGNSATIGGGMFNDNSSPTVTNCILWGDTPGEIYNAATSTPTVTYSDVQGGYAGEGNINADPLFANPVGGDLRLLPGSPCIDAGNSTALPVGLMADLDGNVRSVDDPATPDTGVAACGATVDMGAYEVQAFHPADFNHDGFVSAFDLAQLLGAWGPWP
jgi:hypothetical protein